MNYLSELESQTEYKKRCTKMTIIHYNGFYLSENSRYSQTRANQKNPKTKTEKMQYKKTALNEVKRGAKKASYKKKEIYAILDATEICHIAFQYQNKPFVQPINFGRCGNKLYLHGSHKNRMTHALIESKEVCLNVLILDAMKLTRSAFHHSVNYRSAMIFGTVRELTKNEDKLKGLKCIINHFIANRWYYCRKPNESELKATRVLEINIKTAAAKIAEGPPNDNQSDLELDFWAGTIPVQTTYENPIPDKFMGKESKLPQHILDFFNQRK